MTPSLTAIIPVFNSEASLPELLARLKPVLEKNATSYEVILVNDGSTDQSARVLSDLARQYAWARPIHLTRNFGQHNALLCGIRAACYDIIITLDDDLQNPPEEIPRLLAALQDGHDVVYGTPLAEQHGVWRNAASLLTKWTLQKAMGSQTARKISAFRAFRTSLRDAFAHFSGPRVSIDVLLTWGTNRFASLPVNHEARKQGKSNYSFFMLLAHAIDMMLGFSTWPLRFTAILGLSLAMFGVIVLIYVIGRYFFTHSSVPGFPFLASIISIFSGAQLFSMGILGEYIARIYLRSMERPSYLVRADATKTPDVSL